MLEGIDMKDGSSSGQKFPRPRIKGKKYFQSSLAENKLKTIMNVLGKL